VAHDVWKLNVALAVGLAVCVLGFVVELRRGLDGNFVAWVYVIEWPLFAGAGAYLWWRLRHEDPTTESSLDRAAVDDPEDAGLRAWREYVDRLESGDDSPGGRAGS
jgi:hypothetical protein